MANIPPKFFYNFDGNEIVTDSGSPVRKQSFFPSATIDGLFNMNYQLSSVEVTDTGNVISNYQGITSATACELAVDIDWRTSAKEFDFPADGWLGSGEYYSVVDYEPQSVTFNDVAAVAGTIGSLALGEWGFANDKLWVRLFDDTDPDTKADGWVKAVYQSTTDPTLPMIICQSDNFNLADSWWDTETESFRNPDITEGELTFLIDARRLEFYMKLGGNEVITGNGQIDFFLDGNYDYSKNMSFYCYNRVYRGSEPPQAEIIVYSYSKAEADSKFIIGDLAASYPELTALVGTELIPVREGVNTKYVDAETLKTFVDGGSIPIDITDNGDTDITLGDKDTYASFLVEITFADGTNRDSRAIKITHDGTNVIASQLSAVAEPAIVALFDVDSSLIVGSDVTLRITTPNTGKTIKATYSITNKLDVTT